MLDALASCFTKGTEGEEGECCTRAINNSIRRLSHASRWVGERLDGLVQDLQLTSPCSACRLRLMFLFQEYQ